MERALQIAAVVIFGLIVFPVDGKARSFFYFFFFHGHWSVCRLLVCLSVVQTKMRQGQWKIEATCLHSK